MNTVKRHKKLTAFLLSIILIIIVALISVNIFHYYHPTHYKFNDRFIIGSSIEEIEKKYGKMKMSASERNGYDVIGYYLADKGYPDIGLEGFLGKPLYDQYYWIYFDKNGIAQKVCLKETW